MNNLPGYWLRCVVVLAAFSVLPARAADELDMTPDLSPFSLRLGIYDMNLSTKIRVDGVGGNLGKPVLELLDDAVELYILELSSFQLETTQSLKARAAVILNLCEDHMDRYDSFESYVAAKRVIYRHAGCAIVNRDDALAGAQAEGVAKSIGFTMKDPG